uniref:7TM GPCR serpentine receptor class x (Srx) domain-containing protein n=1 Tax=Ditylenchus dipsaci TaxID=166011 RepID=A0A915D5K9_9BILA
MVICSVVVNSMLILVYFKKAFKPSSFFICTWHILMCDMIGLLLQVVIVIPTTFAGCIPYFEMFLIIVCSLDYITYNCSSLFALMLAVNRFTIFVFPKFDQIWFQRPRIFIFLVSIEILVVSFVGASYATGYYTKFSAKEYHFIQQSNEGNIFKECFGVIESNFIDQFLSVEAAVICEVKETCRSSSRSRRQDHRHRLLKRHMHVGTVIFGR